MSASDDYICKILDDLMDNYSKTLADLDGGMTWDALVEARETAFSIRIVQKLIPNISKDMLSK